MALEHRRSQGLTLIEVIVAMAVVVAVLIITLSVYNIWWRSYTSISEKAVIERQLTSTMEIITKELRLAGKVVLVNDFGTLSPSPPATSLFLSLDNGSVLFWSGSDKSNASKLTDQVVDELYFSIIGNDLLTIEIRNSTRGIELSSSIRILNKNLLASPQTNPAATRTSTVSFEKTVKLFE